MIFDTHAHYDDEVFNEDRDKLLKSIKNNGVDFIVNVGASMDSTKKALELAKKYSFIYAAIGVHPSETEGLCEQDMQWLKEQVSNKKVVAIGEIGLDYYWPEPDQSIQKKWFERQLSLASEVKLPIVIHSRDAAKDTLDILKGWQKELHGGVIHCFSYTKEIAREYLNMDYYFGIGGVLTFKNARKLIEAVEYIPIERILLETDCPYLAPEPMRGRRNEPTNVRYVAEKIAALRGESVEVVAAYTYANACQVYRLEK